MEKHEVTRFRRDVVRRTLRLIEKTQITPRMLRMVFHSDELQGFDSPSPDDHIKIFLPATEDRGPVSRDFTPRAWDLQAGTLTLDFALHQAGPATNWASTAQTGDQIQIGGPRGSSVVPDDFDWYLLIGDATAFPSIGRRLETLRTNVPVETLLLHSGPSEKLDFATSANCTVHWVLDRDDPRTNAAALRTALEALAFPNGDGYIWIAAEAFVAHELYRYFVEVRNHRPSWIKAAAYWTDTRFEPDGGIK